MAQCAENGAHFQINHAELVTHEIFDTKDPKIARTKQRKDTKPAMLIRSQGIYHNPWVPASRDTTQTKSATTHGPKHLCQSRHRNHHSRNHKQLPGGPTDDEKLLSLLAEGAFTTSDHRDNCDLAKSYLAPHKETKYFREFIRKKFKKIRRGEELDGARGKKK